MANVKYTHPTVRKGVYFQATTVRHTGRKIRKEGKEFNAVDTTYISPNLYNLAFMLESSSWYEYYRLGSTTLSVREISEQLGFATRNYFSAVFQQVTGKTPMEFRET